MASLSGRIQRSVPQLANARRRAIFGRVERGVLHRLLDGLIIAAGAGTQGDWSRVMLGVGEGGGGFGGVREELVGLGRVVMPFQSASNGPVVQQKSVLSERSRGIV